MAQRQLPTSLTFRRHLATPTNAIYSAAGHDTIAAGHTAKYLMARALPMIAF